MRIFKWTGIVLLLTVGLSSCSRTKDNFFSRTYHRMTAKFNPLFNGEESFNEGVATLETGHVDRYDELIDVYPFGSTEQAQSVYPQMDRAIEKGIKVIQNHNMMIGGQQKNPYVIDAYMLMAKAHFFKQDYFKALEGFGLVIQKFGKSEQALEAQLWAGRANTRIGNEYAARNSFDAIYNNKEVRDRLLPHVYASMAELEISLGNWDAAIEMLNKAIDERPEKKYRTRWQFVAGQVYEKLGMRYEASEAFGEVVSAHPKKYEFYLNARLMQALNFDVYQGNVYDEYDELDDLAKDDKNLEYRDRIYYVKALLALEEENYPLAEESLKKSIRTNDNNREQLGLSHLEMAEINFQFREYVESQAYFDSAYKSLPPDHRSYERVERFRESLNDLVEQIEIIAVNDSLIRLSSMSPSDQRALFEDYIANLKEEEERRAEQQRNRELNRALASESGAMGSGPQAGFGGGGWYFYNETTRSSGIRDFNQKWGRRELTDLWRRSADARVGTAEATEVTETSEEGGSSSTSSGAPTGQERYNIQAYLAQIPKDQSTIDGMHLENQDAYVKLAGIYKEEIKDNAEAIKTYETLLRRYPDSKHAPLAMYALHILFKEKGETAKADEYANKLMNLFPGSVFANQIEGKTEEGDAALEAASAEYTKAYEAFLKKDYRNALKTIDAAVADYPTVGIVPKFELLKALCLAGSQGSEAYVAQLNYIVSTHAGTPEAERAQELLMYVDQAANGGAEESLANSPYDIDPKTPHRVLVIVPNGTRNINDMRNAVSNFNRDFNRLENLQSQSIFLDKDRQLIVVSGFIQQSDAVAYTGRLLQDPAFAPMYSKEIMRIFAISDANYQTFYRLKDVEEYMKFYDQIEGR